MRDTPTRGKGWPSTIVFDLDGTLVDSVGDIAAALNELLSTRGLPPFSTGEVVDFIGDGIAVPLTKAFTARGRPPGTDELSALVATFHSIYGNGLVNLTTPYAGVVDLLSSLNAKGIALGVCTNKEEDFARTIIDRLGLSGCFAVVVGAAHSRPPKPSPLPLLETITRLKGNPQDAIMVGDSVVDVNCARAAGVAFVGVAFGYSRVPLTSFGAGTTINSYADFAAACDSLRDGRQ
jgi:phosphoglycolate phosphatase